MKFRSLLVAAVSLGMLTGWVGIAGSGPKRYRVDMKTSVTQDLTVIGQGEQKQEFALTGFISTTATDSAGGQALFVVVDSLQVSPGSPIPPELPASLAGSKWHGFRQASGRVKELNMETEIPGGRLAEQVIQQIFPPMPAGTPAGKSWTDTTDTDEEGMASRMVTNLQTTADTWEGGKAIRLAASSATSMSGVQTNASGSLNVEGTGSGTGQWLVANDGTVVSGSISQTQNLAVSAPGLPAPIPVIVHIEGTSALLK